MSLLVHLLIALIFALAAPAATADIAFDAAAEGTGTTTFNWTHTPAGTPEAVVVFCIVNAATGVNEITGANYAGTAMSNTLWAANDTSGETGRVESYFVVTPVPTGAQTAECVSATGTSKHGISISMSASNHMHFFSGCTQAGNEENPNCSITNVSNVRALFVVAGLFSGLDAESSVTAGSGYTLGPSHDFTSQTTASIYDSGGETGGNQSVDFTAASDDTAMVGLGFYEQIPNIHISAE